MKIFFNKVYLITLVSIFYFLFGLGGMNLVFNFFVFGLFPEAGNNPTVYFMVSVFIVPILSGGLVYRILEKRSLRKWNNKYVNQEQAKTIARNTLITTTILASIMNIPSK